MNDIDRSVESMDLAIRRRFAWKEVKAEDTMDDILSKANLPGTKRSEAKARMASLNRAILGMPELGEAYQIGASYFKKLELYGGDFDKLWDNHLESLLREYLRGNRDAESALKELRKAFDEDA